METVSWGDMGVVGSDRYGGSQLGRCGGGPAGFDAGAGLSDVGAFSRVDTGVGELGRCGGS